MAKQTRKETRAEAWFGVTHNVPRRGSPAYEKMLREYDRKHKARKNPVRTKAGRVLEPENCPLPLAASMLDARKHTKGGKKIAKFANCDYRSAEYAVSHKPKNAGTRFSGRVAEGYDPTADWSTTSKDGHVLSFWKKGVKGFDLAAFGSRLGWWPTAK